MHLKSNTGMRILSRYAFSFSIPFIFKDDADGRKCYELREVYRLSIILMLVW